MRRPWIKIETATPDKPEICAIATQLRMDEDMVVGKLVRLWSWITVNKVSGSDLGVTKEFLDKLVGRKNFADALEAAGWLIVTDGKLTMPHFERHNSDAAKVRALTAQRVKRHRIAKEIKGEVQNQSSELSVTKSRKKRGAAKNDEVNVTAHAFDVPAEESPRGLEADVVPVEQTPAEKESIVPLPMGGEVTESNDYETEETLSINAEPTFRPLDFEDPPIHEAELENHVFEDPFAEEVEEEKDQESVETLPVPTSVMPEVADKEPEPPAAEPAVLAPEPAMVPESPVPVPNSGKKSKRKTEGSLDEQPMLF